MKKPEQPCKTCRMEDNCYSVHTCDDYRKWKIKLEIFNLIEEYKKEFGEDIRGRKL